MMKKRKQATKALVLLQMIQMVMRILIILFGNEVIRLHTMLMVRRVVEVINAVAVMVVVERGVGPVR